MFTPVISATGLFTPEARITNEELVDCYNRYVDKVNAQNQSQIENQGQIEIQSVETLQHSSTAFIEKASGIKNRYVLQKESILDIDSMAPKFPVRDDNEPSYMVEMALKAANQA